MKKVKIGFIQGGFRSAFHEKIPELRENNEYYEMLDYDDFKYNQGTLLRLIHAAAQAGAELILTPESYLDGWSCNPAILEKIATTIDGIYVKELRETAALLNVWICASLFSRDGDMIFNSTFLIDSKGSIVHVYRKTHETGDVLRQMPYELGNELSVVETPWGKTAILICHDRWYPENYRTLRMRGAELILNPAASAIFWPGHPYYSIHRCTLRSHAYANGLFIASCNSLNHGGHSVVLAPDGTVISEADMNIGFFICNIDPSAHEGYDFISLLKPSLYRFQ